MKNSTKEMSLNTLEQATGGAVFTAYSNDQYRDAGIIIINPGFFDNDGYIYDGQEISHSDASYLVTYLMETGRRAGSVAQAKAFINRRRSH